jgi:hypothetical protein
MASHIKLRGSQSRNEEGILREFPDFKRNRPERDWLRINGSAYTMLSFSASNCLSEISIHDEIEER